MLLDGSLVQLLAGRVMLRGQTLNIPSGLSSTQPIAAGGQSIQAQPGKATKPGTNDDNNGHGGGGGLFGFLGGLGGAAGAAATAMSNTAASALSFGSAGAGASASDASLLAKSLTGASSSVGGIISSLNGIQQSFPTEGLSKAGLNTFLQAQTLGRNLINSMQSMGRMLEGFDGLKPDLQRQVRTNIAELAKPGGLVKQASAAMDALSEYPWEEEAPKTDLPSPTVSPRASESARASPTPSSKPVTSQNTKTTSTSASSSSATPTSTSMARIYFIATKTNTPVEDFNRFVQELDNGVGKKSIGLFRQTYETSLNATQAEGLYNKYPFLMLVHTYVNSNIDEADVGEKEFFHAIPKRRNAERVAPVLDAHLWGLEGTTNKPVYTPLHPRALLPEDVNAPYWKKMISSPFKQPPPQPPANDPPYTADDSGGKGTTIYVLDDGFDISQPVRTLEVATKYHCVWLTGTEPCRSRTHCAHLFRKQ